jgi:hypothetical protein
MVAQTFGFIEDSSPGFQIPLRKLRSFESSKLPKGGRMELIDHA